VATRLISDSPFPRRTSSSPIIRPICRVSLLRFRSRDRVTVLAHWPSLLFIRDVDRGRAICRSANFTAGPRPCLVEGNDLDVSRGRYNRATRSFSPSPALFLSARRIIELSHLFETCARQIAIAGLIPSTCALAEAAKRHSGDFKLIHIFARNPIR